MNPDPSPLFARLRLHAGSMVDAIVAQHIRDAGDAGGPLALLQSHAALGRLAALIAKWDVTLREVAAALQRADTPTNHGVAAHWLDICRSAGMPAAAGAISERMPAAAGARSAAAPRYLTVAEALSGRYHPISRAGMTRFDPAWDAPAAAGMVPNIEFRNFDPAPAPRSDAPAAGDHASAESQEDLSMSEPPALGQYARDSITGFCGVIIARTDHLHGTPTLCIQPNQCSPDGRPVDAQWFDAGRVIAVPSRGPH